ncbi:hypothetical protein [Streptomyces halobius]|uniref:Uncharacterized protein n=1 Tax=Streptomyces halobius TaxID=2879846 RepID=A0ABY4MH86_9ACTN|nr:hypothetical protein [Streptomyces halobius]UQA95686.1 hypothetical protein K9S39_30900 [Streptomyces halobius]
MRAGQRQWKHLLTAFPERYAHAEQQEQGIRAFLDKDVSILKRVRGGVTHRLTLAQLRSEQEGSDAA